jgi:hypothetical protein
VVVPLKSRDLLTARAWSVMGFPPGYTGEPPPASE